jgi:polyisoprenoid-binding protein YceI
MIAMKTSLKTATIVLPLALALTAAGCKNPADGKPEAEVAAPVEHKPAAKKADEKLAISPANTQIKFIGSKVTGSHHGDFKKFSGSVELHEGKPEHGKIAIVIDTTSLVADQEKLTGHLKSPDFFDVAKYPKAEFVSTTIEPDAKGKDLYKVTGNMDLHGVKKSLSFPATITVTPTEVSAKSHFSFNRKDFGILYAGKADDLIRDEVVVDLAVKVPRAK